jgi:hypothetical protein
MLLLSSEIVEVEDSDDDGDNDNYDGKVSPNNFTTPATALLKKTITPDDGSYTTPCVDSNHTMDYNTPSVGKSI